MLIESVRATDQFFTGDYLGAESVLVVIDDLMGERVVELVEYQGPVRLNEIGGMFTQGNVQFALAALLNKPSECIYGIFIAQFYSFAIMKVKEHTHFFNSHSCTPTGRPAKGKRFASAIKFKNSDMKEINNNSRGLSSLASFICSTLLTVNSKLQDQSDLFSLTHIEATETTTMNSLRELSRGDVSFGNSFMWEAEREAGGESKFKENYSGLILDIQTEVIETDSNQPNVKESIEHIINHDQKRVIYNISLKNLNIKKV